MYGYLVPDKSKLRASDFVLYRAFYCGLCCEIGRTYGQLPRFTTNYDFAFFSALLHDYASADIVIEEHKCVLNPVKKKATLMNNPLLERLAAANILLSYGKADDGVKDGDGARYRLLRRVLKKPFRRAEKLCPEAWTEIKRSAKLQNETEKAAVASLDRAADPFASLLRALPEAVLGKPVDDNLKGLCYNIGKFIYLADALDDIADDAKKKRYNPFLAAYGGFTTRKQFIAEHKADIEFAFSSTCGRAAAYFYGMRFTQSRSLLENVIVDGMKLKTDELLRSEKKLPPPRI